VWTTLASGASFARVVGYTTSNEAQIRSVAQLSSDPGAEARIRGLDGGSSCTAAPDGETRLWLRQAAGWTWRDDGSGGRSDTPASTMPPILTRCVPGNGRVRIEIDNIGPVPIVVVWRAEATTGNFETSERPPGSSVELEVVP
jgi:hypothetical protein